MTACDREHGLIYRFGEEIEVLTAGAVRWQRLALLRLLRELAAAHSVSRGGLLVHGAGLAFQDEAIALVGPRRSGKTTLLTHALRTPGARFLSNDRLVLTNDGTLLPLPTIVSVRPGPYRLLPHPATDWAGESVAEPRGISPGQFCALADTEPVAQARLTTLVFPRLCAETRGLEPRPLLPSQAAEQLKNNLFDRRGRCRPSLFQAPEPSWSPETLRHVRCLECRLGSDAYLQPAEVLFRVPA